MGASYTEHMISIVQCLLFPTTKLDASLRGMLNRLHELYDATSFKGTRPGIHAET